MPEKELGGSEYSPDVEEVIRNLRKSREKMKAIAQSSQNANPEQAMPGEDYSLDERTVRIIKNKARAYAFQNHDVETVRKINDIIIIPDTRVPDLEKGEKTLSDFKKEFPLLEEQENMATETSENLPQE